MAVLDLALLWDLGLILLVATLMSYLMRALKQPSFMAYIVAGLIIGPIGLGALNLSIGSLPIGVTNLSQVLILSELGIAFLLFSVGVETDFHKMFEMGRTLIIGTLLQVAITVLFVAGATTAFQILSFQEAVYLGVILAFSSTMVVVKLLSEKHQINTLHGRLMIGFLLVQDVLVILAMPMLANMSSMLSPILLLPLLAQAAALIIIAFLLSRFVYPHLFKFAAQNDELLFLAGVSSCFVFIGIAYFLNFSIAVGAFIAGIALSRLPYNLEVVHKIRGIRDFFATIFFVTLGMQITFGFAAFPLPLILFIFVVAFLLKPALFYATTLFSGYGGRISAMVALSLVPVSEFSFVIANQGYANGTGVLAQTPGLYSLILLTIAVSMAATPYLMEHSTAVYSRARKLSFWNLLRFAQFSRKLSNLESLPAGLRSHVAIAGSGTMGFGIASALHKIHPLVVVDHDSKKIMRNIREGINAIYGSAENQEVWEKVNLKDAKLLVIAIPDMEASLRLLKHAKALNPSIVVFARSSDYSYALKLYENGTDFVIMPYVVATNVFLEKIAAFLESGKLHEISKLRDEFITYLREEVEGELNQK